ncbi:hypothetical protein [Coraliomargarita akajimensis]|nr:hypothetical protein [Coraliomargarita akajimensis]
MLSLAQVRYASALRDSGGPIERIARQSFVLHGRHFVRAEATLREDLIDRGIRGARKFSDANGVGVSTDGQVAGYMAISSAIECWAYHYCHREPSSSLGGLDLDDSRTGFAAFPGLFRRQSRKVAHRKSIERHCLLEWWRGALEHHFLRDPQPGIRAIQIDNPFSAHDVVLLWRAGTRSSEQAYAYAAGSNLNRALWRALVDLDTVERELKRICVKDPLKVDYGASRQSSLVERRMRYFSSTEGMRKFLERLEPGVRCVAREFDLSYDCAVPGPWDEYASVWRTLVRPVDAEAIAEREDFFYW